MEVMRFYRSGSICSTFYDEPFIAHMHSVGRQSLTYGSPYHVVILHYLS